MGKRYRFRHWGISGLLIFLLSIMVAPVRAEDGETVRVGLYKESCGQITDLNNGSKEYDKEYLEEISKYTGWNYEYVTGTWSELLIMLENNEIDLLGSVQKTPEREQIMNFSCVPTAYTTYCLLVEGDSERYTYEDFESFDGMTIGVMKGSVMMSELAKYSEEHDFTYSIKEYATEEDAYQELKEKEVDAICLTDMRNLDDYRIIAHVNTVSFYTASSLARADITDELDQALKKIHKEDKFYETTLYEKYFSSPKKIALTQEEKEVAQKYDKIPVVLSDDYPLISCVKSGSREYQGIVIDVIDKLTAESGIQFEYYVFSDDEELEKFVSENPNALIAPFFINNIKKDFPNLQTLDTCIKGNMDAVCRRNEEVDFDEKFRLAVYNYRDVDEEKLREYFPKAELVLCETNREGIGLVNDGIADMALVNEITGMYELESPYYDNLDVIDVSMVYEDIGFALSVNADPVLVSALNKCLSLFDTRVFRQMVVNNSLTSAYELSLGEWFYKYRTLVIIVSILCVCIVILAYIIVKDRRKQKAEERQNVIDQECRRKDEEYQRELWHQANYDELTEIYNQKGFLRQVDAMLKEDPATVFTVFRINIRGFKIINEIYGFTRGNEVLVQIADKLKKEIGERGVYGRLYSDHFAVCYPIVQSEVGKDVGLNTFYLECSGQRIRVELNVGVYSNQGRNMDIRTLLDYPQIALQNKDKTTSNGFYYYKEEYLAALLKKEQITNTMEDALQTGQFKVFLQPQYEITSHRLVGAEALIRWMHPTEGMISPADFIPIFENNGFIYQLDSYVCRRVCQLLVQWKESGKYVPVSVNLSRVDFQNPELISMLESTIQEYSVPKELLHLEITESAYVDSDGELNKTVDELKQLGYIIEMDDFGHGYSSFNMLKDASVDVIKLDMGFLNKESNMDKGGNVIESLVKLAYSLGMLVIAEGVENEREANFLRAIGCNLVQGYLYGKPMPEESFGLLLENNAIGNKMTWEENFKGLKRESPYWALEKLNIVLQYSHCIIAEYIPSADTMRIVTVDSNGKMQETVTDDWKDKIYTGSKVHPDYRRVIADKMRAKGSELVEFDFMADYFNTGSYEWFHSRQQSYGTDSIDNRIVGIITRV